MRAVKPVLSSDELLHLGSDVLFYEQRCRAFNQRYEERIPVGGTHCALPAGHVGPHEGVELFMARRAIAWEDE